MINTLLNSAEVLGAAGWDLVSAFGAYNLLTFSSGVIPPPTTESPITEPSGVTS